MDCDQVGFVKKENKSVFICQECGYQAIKWMGKCPDCGQWDSFAEELRSKKTMSQSHGLIWARPEPVPIDSVSLEDEDRIQTGIQEFDRVLGGGLVRGSLVLIGGDPGIGKSTLMLQSLYALTQKGYKVLYVSGEESIRQIRMRSKRLEAMANDLLVVSEIEIESILNMVDTVKPDVLVIDSIQTMYNQEIASAPGSVSQVRECTMRLMMMAKRTGIPTFLVGHVTKEGSIAGPRLLEHMVDTVLYFEGDQSHVFRILRSVKNRFGSTNEIGVFEMKEKGLDEIPNPSAVFLAEKPSNVPGSAVTASMEGTRPILVELQALACSSNYGMPRRTILGLDPNRVALLVAVIEKKLGLHLMGYDIYMNVAGGVKVDEPAIDMGIVSAITSSFLDRPIPDGNIVLGEVGLTGEVRAINHVEIRLAEIRKMGFSRCFIPSSNLKRMNPIKDIEIIGIRNVIEAMEALF